MKIEFELNSQFIETITELVEATVDTVDAEVKLPDGLDDEDPELKEMWAFDLRKTLREDCRDLLGLLRHESFGRGELEIDEEVADRVLRACSAVRIKLSETLLRDLSDEELEAGSVDMLTLPTHLHLVYASYVFLAGLQSLLVRELDPGCEEVA